VTTAEQLAPAVAPIDAPGSRPVPAPASEPAPAPSAESSSRRRLSTVAIALVALSPFMVGAVSIIRRGFPPGALFGDRAILGLTTVDAFRAPVLLGPYSRFYWHHPGPLYFYVLNVLSTLFGGGTVGLVLGATAINVAAAVGILVLAHRRGGRPLLVWTAILVTAYLVAIEPIPFDIWNPSVTLIPFVLMLLLAWSVACRDWWAAPWLAFVASFAVQTHVGLVPGVAMAVGFAVVVSVWQQRRRATPLDERERRTISRAVAASLVTTLVVWLPPVIEELTSREGNLTALLHFFTRPGSPHTLSEGLNNTALQATLMLRGVFASVSLRTDAAHEGLVVAVVLSAVAFAAAVVLARKARATDALVLLLLVAVELPVGVYAVTRIVGPIQFYLVQWISAVGFVLWFAVGQAAFQFARTRQMDTPRSRAVTRTVAIALMALLCVSAIRAFPGDAGLVNQDLDVPNNRALFGYVPAAQLLAATRKGETVVLRNDSVTAWEVLAADALLLQQHGRRVQIVESPPTRLLFDDALLVRAASGAQILAFRDRGEAHVRAGQTLLADQGKWSVVNIPAR
jgi:hypothetical protein